MKRALIGLLAAAAAAGGVAISLNRGSTDHGAVAAASSAPTATAAIVRGDLTDTISLSGTVTFVGERIVRGAANGTVTALPAPGRTIRQGQALYRVDREPLVLLYGKLPLYRSLGQGIKDGPDIQQLEKALVALGHGRDVTVDERFTWATARAVRAWQKRSGLPQTGVVDAEQVVFLPSKVRVAEADVALGDRVSPGRQVLTVTRTDRLVHLDVDVADQALARKGAKVTVELPGGGTVGGKVATVGAVARTRDGATTVDVGVRLAKVKGRLIDRAPVTVKLESVSRRDVLSVPVEALLATSDGGYAVEIGGRTVPVKTGVYGGGRVEITGSGLEAGMKVGVPAK